jgi:hypothetical protein
VLAQRELAQQNLRRFLPSTAWMLPWMCTRRRFVARNAAGLASFSPAPTTTNGISRPSAVLP